MGVKYAVNESFFKKWKPEMAYVLGYLYADGSMEDASYLRGKYIRVSSSDKVTIERIKKLMGSEHTIVIVKSRTLKFKHQLKSYVNKEQYLLRIGSHDIYDSLVKLGLYPNKSLSIKFPNIPNHALPHFIRGYFDGDGCVYLEMGRGVKNQKIIKRLSIIFTSGSTDFLKGLQVNLSNSLGLVGHIYEGSGAYRLRYSTGDSVKIFPFIYQNSKDIYLERKLHIFKTYFRIRPQRLDSSVRFILKKLGHVAN